MTNDTGDLGNLKPAPGYLKKRKRIGRGRGSGHGDTATKGHKGAQSRAGYKRRPDFEGGQTPLQRRIPKRGFNVPDRIKYIEIKLSDLERFDGDVINPDALRICGMIKGKTPVVLLGNGEIKKKVKVSVHRATKSAIEKVNNAGGSVEILSVEPKYLRVKRGPVKNVKKDKRVKSK